MAGFRRPDFRTRGPLHDLLKPPLGGFQFLLAMRFQRVSPLIQGDGVFQVDLALFQAGNYGFQLLERSLEALLVYGLAGPFGG